MLGKPTHGAYGVMVNTEVCGTFDSGSIPDRHPIEKAFPNLERLFLWGAYKSNSHPELLYLIHAKYNNHSSAGKRHDGCSTDPLQIMASYLS